MLTKKRRYQGHESFRRILKNKYGDLVNGCSRQNCQKPDVRTRLRPKMAKLEKKQDQREILKSRDIRQEHSKGRVEVDCQNRDSPKEDVCARLAWPKTFPQSLTIQEETRRCHSYFIHMISRTSSESDSSCHSVSNAIGSVNGLMSFISSLLNKDALLAFRRLPDSNVGSKIHLHRFLTRNDPIKSPSGISRLGQTVCQHRQSVDPVNTRIGDSALFFDASCFFTWATASQSKLW